MPDPLRHFLLSLIHRLDAISSQFEFITDTVVRDRLSAFIRDFFILRVGPPPKAYDFATGSPVAEGLLLDALSTYVIDAGRVAESHRLDVQGRLKAFQDDEVTNEQGRSYDEYFGYWRPGAFTESSGD